MGKTKQNPADYIVPLNMNGLRGRMLRMPPPKNRSREILVVYGHHALLEQWWGLAQNFNEYGAVTMPDMPGFGGMDSFQKIGRKPTIDNFADYLAAFIKWQYKRRRVTIIGMSFGFVVATRMLQRYPELVKKVDLLVSFAGFMHQDDFLFKPVSRRAMIAGARICATRPMAFIIRYCALNQFMIKAVYSRLSAGKKRFIEAGPEEFNNTLNLDITLWQANDVRTHWLTASEFLRLDNCKTRVELPVWQVASRYDRYFNNQVIKEHMLVVFRECHQVFTNSKAHTPKITADKKGLAVMLPRKLRQALAKPS